MGNDTLNPPVGVNSIQYKTKKDFVTKNNYSTLKKDFAISFFYNRPVSMLYKIRTKPMG